MPLKLQTASGLWQVLRRLGIHYKRARDYLHSPDPHYDAKLAWIAQRWQAARLEPERYVFLYGDELTFYRQPTLACAYAAAGHAQALAQRSYRSNTAARIIAALNASSGQVTALLSAHTDLAVLRQFHYRLRATYPHAEKIYLVQDNWPVHVHPDVTVILEPQTYPWPAKPAANWPLSPRSSVKADTLPIQLLFLPTYAPWTNPIEKLWRWLFQEHLHLHRLSDAWDELQQRVRDFLERFAQPSPALLRYVGLLPD